MLRKSGVPARPILPPTVEVPVETDKLVTHLNRVFTAEVCF